MSPPSSTRIKPLAAAGLVALGALVVLLMLSRDGTSGSLAVSATFIRAAGVERLQYQITGQGITPVTGTVRISDPGAPTVLPVSELPAAMGYALEITAASADGKVKCARKDTVDIEIDKTTTVDVKVLCRDMSAITSFLQARQATAPPDLVRAKAPPPIEVAPQCTECEKSHIAKGECEPDSGCDGLEGEDERLCMNLLNCMRATNCWIKDPLDCLCGTVDYVECTKGGNGACLAEMQAATKTTDPIKNGTLFFDPSVPAGRANRLISCDKEKCRSHCTL